MMPADIEPELQKVESFLDAASHPWFATVVTAAIVVAALVVVHLALRYLALRITARTPLLHALVERNGMPIALTLPIFGVTVLLDLTPDSLPMIAQTRHLATLALIVALTWVGLRSVSAIGEGVLSAYGDDHSDVFQARRVRTQSRVLSRIMSFMVVLVGASALLMTFPSVRQIGTSMLASAGVAGIVIGFAARPVLSNLLAGLQIAITQPIRIDDVVIVEKEWGWIEHIHSTYVVVRIWDQRRLVVPLNYFIENPFQNWTRDSSELTGVVTWWVDYRMPIAPLREALERLCKSDPDWDGRLQTLQVVDSSDRAIQLRALVSARDAPSTWDLRCRIREGMIDFIQREYPQFLPQLRSSPDSDEQSRRLGPNA